MCCICNMKFKKRRNNSCKIFSLENLGPLWSDCGCFMTTSRKIRVLLLQRVTGCFRGMWLRNQGVLHGKWFSSSCLPYKSWMNGTQWRRSWMNGARRSARDSLVAPLSYSRKFLSLYLKLLLLETWKIFHYLLPLPVWSQIQGLWLTNYKPRVFELVTRGYAGPYR